MTWPHATDYNAAVQNPQLCFRDEDLRQGQAVGDLFGLPRPHSGNFADVYQIQGNDGQSWAIKCFTRPVAGLQTRYQAISDHLRQTQRAFMVEFHFLDEGICIRGQWYPLVKMRWVEGFRLNEFIREQLNKPVVLDRLAHMWVRLAQELRDANMAHGDLQHGNVLLVPGSKSTSLALKLIDYDGMFVPTLADTPSGEIGHPNYQHPQRLREGGYGRHMDRFAHLVIYTALRCLRLGSEELWQRYDNQENLLFREDDFRQPGKSKLLRELWDIKDRETHFLVGHLLLASQGMLRGIPSLDELLDESGIRPLSDREEARIDDLLHYGVDAPSGERGRVSAPSSVNTRSTDATPLAPKPRRTALLAVAPATESSVLLDTQPIAINAKTEEVALPAAPRTPRRSVAEIQMDAQPPEPATTTKKAFDVGTLTDPVISLLSRPAWLAALGLVALVSFLVVNVLVWSSVKPPPALAASRPPALVELENVVLKAGYRKVIPVAIARHDCHEPLTIRVEGLPDTMKTPPLNLSATEDAASLTMLAPLELGRSRHEARLSLWEGDNKVDEMTFHLVIHDVPRPLLRESGPITCAAGQSRVFAFTVERRACQEPLRLRVEGLPPEVRQESLPAADPDSPSIRLSADPDLAAQDLPLKLELHVGDVVADSKPMVLHIQKVTAKLDQQEARRVRLNSRTMDSLKVEAGSKGELAVFLDRRGYRGNLEVVLEGLPNGATVRPVVVPNGNERATLTIETARQTRMGEYPLKLLLRRNEETIAERMATLVVQEPSGRREKVTFETFDHAWLAGTLYHGWKGKKGMTVLMLHDLPQHRGTPGWRRLARALQAEGHTVLTFDFRGHGDSTKVESKFWTYSVNKSLAVRIEDRHANKLKAEHLPFRYLPWLIEDIAAARTYLDLRHDEPDGPVNTFNLVVIGAGQASALGSLWLATEGLRFNAADVGDKIVLKPPEKLSIRQVVWIGMEDPLKLFPTGVYSWLRDAHAKPVVPITFIYGADDFDTTTLLREPIHEKLGKPLVLPETHLAGQQLLDDDPRAAERIQHYLVKRLGAVPPEDWVPRKIQGLRSYWALPLPKSSDMRLFVTAKRPGDKILSAVPLRQLGIPIEGSEEVTGVLQKLPEPR